MVSVVSGDKIENMEEEIVGDKPAGVVGTAMAEEGEVGMEFVVAELVVEKVGNMLVSVLVSEAADMVGTVGVKGELANVEATQAVEREFESLIVYKIVER